MFLYIDNFRGFSDTTINFSEVNFLVGENSTGKTTVLSLLKLMTTSDFWRNGSFESDLFDFGFFDDILSKNSRNKKSFYIGIGKSPEHFVLCKYVNNENTPSISRIIYKESKNIYLIDQHKRYSIVTNLNLEIDDICQARKIISKRISEKGKKSLKMLVDMPIFFLINYGIKRLESDITKEESKSDIINISFKSNDFSEFFKNLSWIAPIRTSPQSIYFGNKKSDSPSGENAPFTLRSIYKSRKYTNTLDYINEYGKKSGLFDSISINTFGENADTNPFSVDINYANFSNNIKYTGYGISQILPIILDMTSNRRGILIQQPEVHLHPRAQAEFGTFLYKIVNQDKVPIFIETHSDFIIDRYRLEVARSDNKKKTAKVLFFFKSERHNSVHEIIIDENGRYPENQPSNFRNFFLNESLSILEV